MQREISDMFFSGRNLNAIDDARRPTAIDRTASNYDGAKEKVRKMRDLIGTGKYYSDLAKYIPGLLELAIQGMMRVLIPKKKVLTLLIKI